MEVDEAGHGYASPLPGERSPDEPVVAEGVDDAALPHAVRLVRDGEKLGRARGDRARRDRVRVIDDEADAYARPAERRRAEVGGTRVLVNDAERLAVERELRDDLTGRRREAAALHRAERARVELDRLRGVPHRQEGRDRRDVHAG